MNIHYAAKPAIRIDGVTDEDRRWLVHMTNKDSFYENNGARFKGQNSMTREEELLYAAHVRRTLKG